MNAVQFSVQQCIRFLFILVNVVGLYYFIRIYAILPQHFLCAREINKLTKSWNSQINYLKYIQLLHRKKSCLHIILVNITKTFLWVHIFSQNSQKFCFSKSIDRKTKTDVVQTYYFLGYYFGSLFWKIFTVILKICKVYVCLLEHFLDSFRVLYSNQCAALPYSNWFLQS